MTDRANPTRSTPPEKPATGFVGALYLALAGAAMTGWIAFLVWIARRLIAEL